MWHARVRMGENTIGNIVKSMASCLKTTKKQTNHSMRKTLVSKLKKSGKARNVICEITGHSRESSLDDYDEMDENQRKDLRHIISGYQNTSKENPKGQQLVKRQRVSPPTVSINNPVSTAVTYHFSQQSDQPTNFHPYFLPCQYGFPLFQRSHAPAPSFQMATTSNVNSVPSTRYTDCTMNNYFTKLQDTPQPQKKRRAFFLESDDED